MNQILSRSSPDPCSPTFSSSALNLNPAMSPIPRSSPPDLNPVKRPNPTWASPPDLSPAKRSRPNSPELPDYAIDIMRHVDINERRLYCKRVEEIQNRWLEGLEKIRSSYPKEVLHSGPKFDPSQPLPEGYAWGSYCPRSGIKSFAVKMHCIGCGVGLDHWPDDCPKKGTEEYERNFAILLEPNSDSDDETETETETKTKTV